MGTGVHVTKGHDVDYPRKQVAASRQCEPLAEAELTTHTARDLAAAKQVQGSGYYRAAADAGEPPGRWWGPGAVAIGLEPGGLVDHDMHQALFEDRIAPDGTKLGRAPVAKDNNGEPLKRTSVQQHYSRLRKAEPHADPARLRELKTQAQRKGRSVVYYYDVTFQETKSPSVVHASFGADMADAETRGDAVQAHSGRRRLRTGTRPTGRLMSGACVSAARGRLHADGDARGTRERAADREV